MGYQVRKTINIYRIHNNIINSTQCGIQFLFVLADIIIQCNNILYLISNGNLKPKKTGIVPINKKIKYFFKFFLCFT